ncbi:DUF4202 domain-containing protein [Thalassotalea profundi]|uniref:DUF4202 domain-containing protein n=1 Tax=Thalassotalea profundi TaxID=2036687 RepID=A0ABQ3IPS8_9GAMM|nr:DUF4202 domain-containing protein [Thalassotalea profundi]GHE87258.1 hypothetical protein GCM10011501_15820 [Thalassotalea profundi]
MSEKLNNVLNSIDRINSQDPNVTIVGGIEKPKELLYGQYMSECLAQHWPDADEYLQIAVRAQHIKRWHLKRSDFSEGKQGYLTWRKALGLFHAQTTKELMIDYGYEEVEAETTSRIIRKENLKSNQQSQTLEDVACLVFLQHYFEDFATKHSEEKIIRILQLTWRKMSEKGHNIALTLTLPSHLSKLVEKALS